MDTRLGLTKLIKQNINEINPLLSVFTQEINNKDCICTMYGNYSYLSLLKKLNTPFRCVSKEQIEIKEDFTINCPLEETMINLNMLVITKNDKDEAINKCEFLLTQVKDIYYSKYKDITFNIEKIVNKKLFSGFTISLQIKDKGVIKRRYEGEEEKKLEFLENDFISIFTIDIYTENLNFDLFRRLIQDNPDHVKTLTKEGYIILSSFVYYNLTIDLELPLNKIRFSNILRLFPTQEIALSCVLLADELFKNEKSSFILKQFLIHFDIKYNDGTTEYNFSDMESTLNNNLLDQKNFKTKEEEISLREVIDFFIKDTDRHLQELEYGRFLKTGGDVYRKYSTDEILTNDIDTKLFLTKNTKVRQTIISDNVVSSLFFIIDELNRYSKKIKYDFTFIFAGITMELNIENKMNDYLNLTYSSLQLIQLLFNIDVTFIFTSRSLSYTLKHNNRSDPLDIWIYDKTQLDKIEPYPVIDKNEIYCSREYFIDDLKESFTDPSRKITRFYKDKLNKDKRRLDFLLKNPEINNEYEIKDLSTTNFKFITNIINLFWIGIDIGGKSKAESEIKCKCKKEDKVPICDLYLAEYLKCKFLSFNNSDNDVLLGYLNDFIPEYIIFKLPEYYGSFKTKGIIFALLILLITKLSEIEFCDNKVTVNIDPFLYLKADSDSSIFTIKKDELIPNDIVYLAFYSSNTNLYKRFNEKLLKEQQLSDNEIRIRNRLDYILTKGKINASLEKPIILYRGVNMKLKDFKEEDFKQNSFLSTSIEKSVGQFFADNTIKKKCCIMKIIIKEDIEGIYLNLLNVGISTEKEVLLPRNLELTYKESYLDNQNYYVFVFEYGRNKEFKDEIKEEIGRKHIEEKQEQSIIVSEEQKVQINDVPVFENYGQKIKFMKDYIKGIKFHKEQLRIFIISENNGPKRKGKIYDNYFERFFGLFCLQYIKEHLNIEYDFSTTLNTTLTLEYKDSVLNTTLRQLLNTFVSTTHNLLKNESIGKLYKTGGESVRYYTKDKGDQVTNDIDSKFCCNTGVNIQQTKIRIFKRIAMLLIYLAIIVKFCNFKIEHFSLIEKEINFGYITSYQQIGMTRELIPEYIAVRTNYVGDCWGVESKSNKECLNIISLDKNHKIVLDGLSDLFNGEIIHFYYQAAPYDFLFSNENCKDVDIQERKDDMYPKNPRNPPVVSLYFVIRDFINLLTPRDYQTTYDEALVLELKNINIKGDLEKRINTGKHNKDIKRYIALIDVYNKYKDKTSKKLIPYGDENIKDRSEQLSFLFKEIEKIKEKVNVDIDVDKLDQTCDYTTPGICVDLQKTLVESWKGKNNTKIIGDAEYLFTIFDKNPGQFVKVPV